MTSLRILFLFPFGGINPSRSGFVMAQGIINDLLKRGHEIYVIPSSQDEFDLARTLGLKTWQFDREDLVNRVLRRILFVQTKSKPIYELARLVESNGIDVILERHQLVNAGFYVSKITGVPYVTNEFIVYPDLKHYTDWVIRAQLRMFPKGYFRAVERKAFLHASAIVALKEKYIEELIEEYGIPPERIFRFYAMVDKNYYVPGDKARACSELGLDCSKFIVTYVGSFDRLHTPHLLIPVIQRLGDLEIQFVLVGDGPLLDTMKNELKQLSSKHRVVFPGRVGRDRVLRYIQAADLCVESIWGSIWNERVLKYGADSFKIYEYMACGKPIIASDLPGQIQELGKSGAAILLDPTDVAEFARAIRNLYENRDFAVQVGRRARQLVEENWNWDYTGTVIEKALLYAARGGTRWSASSL